MNKKSIRTALFVCVLSLILVGGALFFSIKLSNEYSDELSVFNQKGKRQAGYSDSFEYSQNTNAAISQSQSEDISAESVFEYNNIQFISYSRQWDEAKLEELAYELFNNVHGDEIAYVARVELHNGNYDEYAGLHRNSYEKYSLPVTLNNLLPDDMTIDFSTLSSVIILTGADENTTVASMARTLSHEYGHHFTQYYFGFNGTATDMVTKYALLRNEPDAPVYAVVTDWDYYIANHMWDIQEIAAEDYVFLMGSPLARQQIDYLDNSELVSLYANNLSKYNEYLEEPLAAINAYPHENPELESPSQVEGLAEYYYSFVDEDAPEYSKVTSDYGTMDLNITQTASDSYNITWVCPWPYMNISYTLVAYDEYDYILKPIKTITGDEDAIAKFGVQKLVSGQSEYTIDDTLDTLGHIRFRIVVTFSDGSVIFSDPYDVMF